jgi:hypothetical protein
MDHWQLIENLMVRHNAVIMLSSAMEAQGFRFLNVNGKGCGVKPQPLSFWGCYTIVLPLPYTIWFMFTCHMLHKTFPKQSLQPISYKMA